MMCIHIHIYIYTLVGPADLEVGGFSKAFACKGQLLSLHWVELRLYIHIHSYCIMCVYICMLVGPTNLQVERWSLGESVHCLAQLSSSKCVSHDADNGPHLHSLCRV